MDIRRNYSRIFFLRCNLFYKEVFSLSNNLTRNTSISVSVYCSSHLMSNPFREALFRFIGIFVGLEPSHYAVVVMVIIFLCGTILCLIILPPKQPPHNSSTEAKQLIYSQHHLSWLPVSLQIRDTMPSDA